MRFLHQILKIKKEQINELRINKQSLDARKKPEIYYSYEVDITVNNENKEFYIPLPYKLKFIEMLIEDAISKGLNFRKIHNEITPEAEQCLIENGYKVKYYKHFIKVSW